MKLKSLNTTVSAIFRRRSKLILWIFFTTILFLFSGCAVPSHDFRTSENIERSIDNLVLKKTVLKEKALLLMYTDQNERLNFKLQKESSEKFALCELDKDSFVALIVTPGKYFLQTGMLELKAGGVYIIKGQKHPSPSKSVSYYDYQNDRRPRKYLSKNIFSEDKNIQTAAGYFPNQVRTAEVFGYNLGNTLLVVFYVIKSPFWCIHWLAYPCFLSFNPAGLAVGGLIYLLTFWAVPESQRSFLKPLIGWAVDSAANHQSKPQKTMLAPSNSTVVTPNAYGPGIHSDQYGRPVKTVSAF